MIDTRVLPEDHFDFMSVSESIGVELYKIICALNRRTKLGELVWRKITEENHDLVLPCNSKTSPEVFECTVDNQRIIFQSGIEDSILTFVKANNTSRLSFDLLRYTNRLYNVTRVARSRFEYGVELAIFHDRFASLGERLIDTIRNAVERERFHNARKVRLSLEGSEAHVRGSGAKNRDALDWITNQ